MTIISLRRVAALCVFSLLIAGCGSSGGTSQPPVPPAPVTPPPPPPPPPEPTFEERLAEWAEMDPNDCRARTPGFEALGGWLKDDGRELGMSRIWVRDNGSPSDMGTHGGTVWDTLTDCAVRTIDEARFFTNTSDLLVELRADGEDGIRSQSLATPYQGIPFPDLEPLSTYFPEQDGSRDGQRVLIVEAAGNDDGKRTGNLQSPSFQGALSQSDTALWLVIGGYVGEGDNRAPADASSICGAADPLCLFAPWRGSSAQGTSQATPQVSAALDSVWAVWPDMDILDLRNLAFDCAENMSAPDGEDPVERSYSYSNGRTFTSETNSTWGHGILSLTCLFTPNGGLQDPTTGNAISGGIIGPIAGPVTGALITGIDYTGRDFAYGFARPVARENFALLATTAVQPSKTISRVNALGHGSAVVLSALAKTDRFSLDLTASGNAIGIVSEWRFGRLTFRGGFAAQPEGVGSLTGSRAFRAPSAVSAAITAAYAEALPNGFSAHVQADHWRTLATWGRSLWEGAQLSESRISAALVRRIGRHEFALQGVWRSGLSGSLDVSGRSWAASPQREKGLWLTWNLSR